MSKGKGFIILYIGTRDSGKTTKCKSNLEKSDKDKFVFDFQNEYGGELIDFDEFIDKAIELRNHDVVIEEATVYLSNKGDDKRVKHLIASASHHNNNIHIVYHSLRSIPTYIMDLCNFYYLFKTGDNVRLIESKFKGMDDVLKDFKEVRASNKPHFYICRKHL